MRRYKSMVQFGPKYGIQVEFLWNWWAFRLGGSVYSECGLIGFSLSAGWLGVVVFREKYEPYMRYHLFQPSTPFSLEAA